MRTTALSDEYLSEMDEEEMIHGNKASSSYARKTDIVSETEREESLFDDPDEIEEEGLFDLLDGWE